MGGLRSKDGKNKAKEAASYIIVILAAVVLAAFFAAAFCTKTTVVGSAMEPTLSADDRVWINRMSYLLRGPSKGDVILFLPNGNEKSHYYVRRVVATPGDRVQIKDGVVYVNGQIDNTVDAAAIRDAGLAEEEITLGDDEYFVLGDNRNNSEDSRNANIGNVRREYIIGKAWFYSSLSGMGWVH